MSVMPDMEGRDTDIQTAAVEKVSLTWFIVRSEQYLIGRDECHACHGKMVEGRGAREIFKIK